MLRRITRAIIFIITVLSSYLITGALEDRILSETERFRPVTATAVGMAVIVLIFVPIFAYLERITEAVVKTSLKQSRSGAGRVIGILLFVAIALTILFALFLDRWFNMSLIDVMQRTASNL